jgi:hydroxypyruvate isomerase
LQSFSANLSMLWPELPFLSRFSRAADAGFEAIEFLFPYAHESSDVRARLQDSGLIQDLFNLPAGDFELGERGLAVDPARRSEFDAGIDIALETAATLDCWKLNCLVGNVREGLDQQQAYETLVDNLTVAANRLGAAGRLLLVEVLNPVDAPAYFLNSIPLAERLLTDVNSAHLRFQFDVYHIQRTQGELVTSIHRLAPWLGHVQIADAPNRGQPGTGEINYRTALRAFDEVGYTGRIGLEYRPVGPTDASFDWMDEYRAEPSSAVDGTASR